MDLKALFPTIPIQLGFGFIAGLIVGYTAKKVTKYVAILLGIFFIGLQILAYYKFVVVDWNAVAGATQNVIKSGTATSPAWWKIIINNFPYAGTFTMGFIIGFKKG